ncbi:MAG: NAD(P)/FAD-dependent oxidoreductase [Pseudomonadales bacterium]|nr:NAD(P)/FAD-dependent oxidoreductase [Pseudomonadales bacterium]
MTIHGLDHLRPITASDAEIEAALEDAHIPALMCALVHITGDANVVRGPIKPVINFFGDEQGNISPEDQATVRARAREALCALRDGARLPAPPSQALVNEMVDFIVDRALTPEYGEFLHAELMLSGEDPYAPVGLDELPAAARAGFKVAIIGAGMSGILAGIRLQAAGIPFEIIERHEDVGGTWYQNTYPGCRVDSPNHIYSYSFRPADWPQYYSPQPVLRDYFDATARDYGLKAHTRFGTEVKEARFDERGGRWRLTLERRDGTREELETNAVISAVGQLNRPKWPDVPGRERFEGISFHSTEWQHEHDLTGKRILVIGTGASAFQFAPEIAKVAGDVTIFQRTPPWMAPVPTYHDNVPAGKHWLLNHVPYYAKWYRFSMFWNAAEGLLHAVRKDPAWNGQNHSISAANDEVRQMFTDWIAELCEGDTELFRKVVPKYPVGAKRILLDNGNWMRALRRDNVHLVDEPVREITTTGVVTESGIAYDADVIIYGTGFEASRFLWPMRVYGRSGKELQAHWNGDPRAYLGITIPGFPNLFCCYGPNTNIVANGSIIFFSECEVRYILGCIGLLLRGGHAALDCRRDVHDAYNQAIDAENLEMAWGAANVPTWYKNTKGRVTQNWPYPLVEFWHRTRRPNPTDYQFLDAGAA